MASPRKRRTLIAPAAMVAAVAVAVSLLIAFRPDGGTKPTAAETPTSPAAHTPATPTSAEPEPAPPRPTPTPKPTPKPKPKAKPPSPASQAASASLAGRIRPEVTYEGTATFYDTGDGNGACLYGPTTDVMTAAMNHTDYETSKACGAYVRVSAANGASVTVRITNECPLPCAPGQLDLSPQAFAKLAAPSAGQIPVTWTLLSPATTDKISIRYKTGSSRYWCALQAVGHRNPLARLEVRSLDNTWRRLARTEYNYFLSEQGEGCGTAIRLTDIYGETLTVEGLAVRPDALQPTGLQFAAH